MISSGVPEHLQAYMKFLGDFAQFVGAAHYLVRVMMVASKLDDEDPLWKIIMSTRQGLDFLYSCLSLPDQPTFEMEQVARSATQFIKERLQEDGVIEKETVH